MGDRQVRRACPVGYALASADQDGVWVVWRPSYSASYRRWRFERLPIALVTLGAAGVLVGGEWFALAAENPFIHVAGPFVVPVLAVVLFFVGAASLAADPTADAAFHPPGAERRRHGHRCFAGSDFSDPARAGAKGMVESLRALYLSRTANEGWLDQELLEEAHVIVWETLQRLAGSEDLRSAIADGRRHPELAVSIVQSQQELNAVDRYVRTISARLADAAQQAKQFDDRLDALEAQTQREADRERARARLDGAHAPTPNDAVSRELSQEAVEAIRARIEAAQEVLRISDSATPHDRPPPRL